MFTPRQATAPTGSAFDTYRSSLGSCPPLDRNAERDLARRYRGGDQRAGVELIQACLPFVVSIAFEYRRWGAPLEDIVQEGNIGLLRAAAKFDPERDVRLVTYAAYWIRASIREYVVRAYRIVRLGTTKGERKALRAYRTTSITDVEGLSAVSGLSKERVEALLPLLSRRETSLDEAGPAGEPSPAMAKLAAVEPSPEQTLSDCERAELSRNAIDEALATLSEREQLIVRQRMMVEDPSTLQALGEVLGVSKERVRQLEERARAKLRVFLADFAEAS